MRTNDYDSVAAYYDCEHAGFHDDIEFYLEEISAGPVLEVGTGSGRILAPLALSGLEAWGVDPSAAMLARAERRLQGIPHVHLIRQAAQDLNIGAAFATAILGLNMLWHLPTQEEQLSLLAAVRRHLVSGGILLIDCSNPHELADRGATGGVRLRFKGECDGERLTVWSAAWDQETDQTLDLQVIYDARNEEGTVRRTEMPLALRYLYRSELELMLRLTGFAVDAFYGSYQRESYGPASPSLLAVAHRGEDAD